MTEEDRLPFRVEQVTGGFQAYDTYSDAAVQVLEQGYPEINLYKNVWEAIQDDFGCDSAKIFLLFLDDRLVGFSSYWQLYVCSAREQEMNAFSLSADQWMQMQKSTATAGWTVIHPNFQHKGGWSKMMDVFDASLVESDYEYVSRKVRKKNDYDQKVARRYKKDIVFQTDSYWYGPQKYFRIAISRE